MSNPYEGTDLWAFRQGRAMLDHHRVAGVDLDVQPVWVLPADVLPGASSVYGLDVVRAEVERPMLAYPFPVEEVDE